MVVLPQPPLLLATKICFVSFRMSNPRHQALSFKAL
jgi:hypothetical protein